jgi:hypothetical protein
VAAEQAAAAAEQAAAEQAAKEQAEIEAAKEGQALQAATAEITGSEEPVAPKAPSRAASGSLPPTPRSPSSVQVCSALAFLPQARGSCPLSLLLRSLLMRHLCLPNPPQWRRTLRLKRCSSSAYSNTAQPWPWPCHAGLLLNALLLCTQAEEAESEHVKMMAQMMAEQQAQLEEQVSSGLLTKLALC